MGKVAKTINPTLADLNKKVNEAKPMILLLGIMYFLPRGERDHISNPCGGCRVRLFRLVIFNPQPKIDLTDYRKEELKKEVI